MADHTPEELKARFWKALRSDMTVMLGVAGRVDARPMTAQVEDDKKDEGPIWFFGAKDSDLAREVMGETAATFTFVSKGHDIWANVEGTLTLDTNRAKVDELWNPYVAAWYEGGKDDPKLALFRFEPGEAKIWLDAHSFVAGLLILLGRDPKKDYQSNVAEVRL